MDGFKFNQRVKHGRLDFHPGVLYGFEDPDAAPYFGACGWGESADIKDEADAVVISKDELDIDPLTVWGTDGHNGRGKGQFVMPDRAAAHLREQGHDVSDEWADTYVATFVPGIELMDHIKAEGSFDA